MALSSLMAVALLAGGALTAYATTSPNNTSNPPQNNGQPRAVNGDNFGPMNSSDQFSHPCSLDRHEAMEEAFENNDYQAWKELMKDRGRVSEVVNKDNFDQFQKMHEAMEEGNYDKAAQTREDLGLNPRPHHGGNFQGNRHMEGNMGGPRMMR